MLHEDPEHKIYLKPYIFEAICSLFKEDAKDVKAIIDYSVNVCELFQKEDDYIFSQRVLDNLSTGRKTRRKSSSN